MKNYLFPLSLIIMFLACSPPAPKEKPLEESSWKSLFNGENLDGWVMKIHGYELGDNYANTARVEDGILKISYDDYERYDQRYGALIYEQPFADYRLKVEYRFVGDTAHAAPSWGFRDSGIQYHGQSPESIGKDQPFPICLEYNLHGGDGENERPVGQICTIGTKVMIGDSLNTSFCTPATIARTFHGDQWVTAEIEVKGDSISHWINGEKILEFTQAQYDPENEFANALMGDGAASISSGYISVQSNSHPIQFRKIEILEY